MIFLAPILYIIINVVDAYSDRNRVVNHKRGALIYAAACFIIAIPLLVSHNATWLDVCVFPLITRAAFFDPVLNLIRGKSILYEGKKKPKGEGSFIDELERRIGLSTFWLRIVYLKIYISYVIFIYVD
jgi:hypothetical protein